MKVDPIIAVKDVEKSSIWYQTVFDCSSMHGGNEFDILISKKGDILLCLHKWGEHEHPTMQNPKLTPGNGLILYFRTENMEAVRQRLQEMDHPVEEDIRLNPNSGKREFSVIDLNGYYLTITEFHEFAG